MSEKNTFPTNVELHFDEDGEWSALYVDGKLDCYGDSYLQDERIHALFGVKIVNDSPWLLGGDGRNRPPAQTTAEIDAYEADRNAMLDQAIALRNQAAELRRQAVELERESRDV